MGGLVNDTTLELPANDTCYRCIVKVLHSTVQRVDQFLDLGSESHSQPVVTVV